MILEKMGIKMKKEDGEAFKKSTEEVRQLLLDTGVAPTETASASTSTSSGPLTKESLKGTSFAGMMK